MDDESRLSSRLDLLTRRMRWDTAALRFRHYLFGLRVSLELRYAPDQPRVPRGNANGGQWTSVQGESTPLARGRGQLMAEIGERLFAWKEPGMIG